MLLLLLSNSSPKPRENEPLLPLAHVLCTAIPLLSPRSPPSIHIHLVYLLYLEPLLRHRLLEEECDFGTSRMEACDTIYTRGWFVGEEV